VAGPPGFEPGTFGSADLPTREGLEGYSCSPSLYNMIQGGLWWAELNGKKALRSAPQVLLRQGYVEIIGLTRS